MRQYQVEWYRAQSVYLCSVGIWQQLHILVPAGLILCYVVSERFNDCSVEPFDLAIGLGVIHGRAQVLNSQGRSYGWEELRDEMKSFIGQ